MLFRAWSQKRGRFGTDPYIISATTGCLRLVNSACFARIPYPMDALSDMVTKKGRFGTDPYDIFATTGRLRLVNSACFARTPSPTPDEKPNPPIYLQFYLSTQTDLRIDNRKNLFPGESSIAGFHHSIMSFIFDDAPSDGSGNKLQIALPGCLRNEIPIFSPV